LGSNPRGAREFLSQTYTGSHRKDRTNGNEKFSHKFPLFISINNLTFS